MNKAIEMIAKKFRHQDVRKGTIEASSGPWGVLVEVGKEVQAPDFSL